MRKSAYFDSQEIAGWPEPRQLEPYFFAPAGQQWFNTGGNDGASLTGQGLHGTQHLGFGKGRVDVQLDMWGNPQHGVLLIYAKRGGGFEQLYSSKGDMRRLRELICSLHGTPLPAGLFIPFEKAWKAMKEFIETEGALPKSIQWIANEKLPPSTFPDP